MKVITLNNIRDMKAVKEEYGHVTVEQTEQLLFTIGVYSEALFTAVRDNHAYGHECDFGQITAMCKQLVDEASSRCNIMIGESDG